MSDSFGKHLYKFVCVLVILITAGIRIHLADIPFERDEGEYAYAGQMITHGIPPYQEVYNMKFPGVYFMFALSFKLFGEGVFAPRYMTLLLQLFGAGFIFLLARRAINPLAGWLSAAVFMLFNLTLALQGTQSNAEHFLVAFLIPSLYFLFRGVEEDSVADIFVSGILIAIACLMKQHAFIFTFVGLLWILYIQRLKSFRYLLAYAVGGIIPVVLMFAYLWHAGVWDRFYFLTIQYAREYVGVVPFDSGIHQINPVHQGSSNLSPLLVWFIFASLSGLFIPGGHSKTRVFLLILLLASALSVMPGFYFRRHYFLMTIPAISLLFAYTTFRLSDFFKMQVRFLILSIYIVGSAGFFFYYQRDCFFFLAPENVTERLYHGTPFTVSGKIASFIKAHTGPNDRICMIGAEPQLFFLSQRRSASGYIYIYPLLENQKYAGMMTDEFIAQSEHYKPAILVYSSKSVFEDGYNHDSRLYKWFDTYKKQYKLAAICTPISESDLRMAAFDTIAPMDTFAETVPQMRVYERIDKNKNAILPLFRRQYNHPPIVPK